MTASSTPALGGETLLTLSEAARTVPKLNGRRAHPSTLWRWCRKGVGGVRLQYIRVGRRVATSREALGRFFEALAKADDPPPGPPSESSRGPRTEGQRERDVQDAEKQLSSAGI